MSAKVEDLNDLAKQGRLPADIKAGAVPVNGQAKEQADDEARVVTVRHMLQRAMQRSLIQKTHADILTTGHWEMDRDTGGFRPECVWLFGAKSSWGKSSYLVMVADENIKRGKRVLIVSAEDPESLYGDRLLVRRARVDRHRLEQGALRRDERDRVSGVVNAGEDIPVFLDARGKTVEWAAKKVRKLIASEGVHLVAWDYLHAFDQDKPSQQGDRRAQLNYISRTMTDVTKTSGCAGMIFAQVTPDGKDLVPDMYSIRDTKDVVNAAEVVGIGFEPAMNVSREAGVLAAEAGSKAIVLAKNKPGPGPKGRVYGMASDKVHQCFDRFTDKMDVYDPTSPMRYSEEDEN